MDHGETILHLPKTKKSQKKIKGANFISVFEREDLQKRQKVMIVKSLITVTEIIKKI
jgi:hypothetical protein